MQNEDLVCEGAVYIEMKSLIRCPHYICLKELIFRVQISYKSLICYDVMFIRYMIPFNLLTNMFYVE